jgi:hypothetical protein
MKRIQKYLMIAGFAVAMSLPALGSDWRGGGVRGGGARVSFARPQVSHFSAPAARYSAPARFYTANTGFRSQSFRTAPRVATGNFAVSRGGTARTFAAYNRSNNYGGRWVAANAHPYWNRGREYYWGGHYYRWFDGGWLIVDAAFWPYGYPYGYPYAGYETNYYNPPDYSNRSVAADVQAKLAQLGYYNGDVDGNIGPLSRQAISKYQSDQALPVTGAIDEQLLQSMGLE